MTTHTFICENCGHQTTVSATLRDGPPATDDKVCPNCDTVGQWQKVWDNTGTNVVWAAMDFTRNEKLDQQRRRGEYIIDRKE